MKKITLQTALLFVFALLAYCADGQTVYYEDFRYENEVRGFTVQKVALGGQTDSQVGKRISDVVDASDSSPVFNENSRSENRVPSGGVRDQRAIAFTNTSSDAQGIYNHEIEAWALMTSQDFSNSITPKVSFWTQQRHVVGGGATISVWVSENYTHGDLPNTATWTNETANIVGAIATSDVLPQVYVNGEIDLSKYSSSTVTVAFKVVTTNTPYSEGASQHGTFYISDVRFEETTQSAQIWKKYIGSIDDSSVPVLPNYSFAGYKLGAVGIPTSNATVFNVASYGAIPNDGLSDVTAIEDAIAAAQNAGGGVVFFPPGVFTVNAEAGNDKPILISGSNIVLRGSGSGIGGTVINMKNAMAQEPGVNNLYQTNSMFEFDAPYKASSITTLVENADKGTNFITVGDASKLKISGAFSKFVRMEMAANKSANNLYLDGKTDTRSQWTKINTKGVTAKEFHEIDYIQGNTIYFKDKLINDIKASHNWTVRGWTMIEESGFEDIHFIGNFTDDFEHHKDYLHDSGWKAIRFSDAAHCWLRRSRFSNVSYAADLGHSYAVSIIQLLVDQNRGHGLVAASGSSRILMGLIWDNTNFGQWHGIDVSGNTTGSVAWRIDAIKGRGMDMHGSFPRSNLYDLYNGFDVVGNGGASANLPNHLGGLTLWNHNRAGAAVSNYDFWDDCGSEYCGAAVANPIIVGYHGSPTTFHQPNVKYEESNGIKVYPESLYEAQVEHRLGNKPAWMDSAILEYENLKNNVWYAVAPNYTETINNLGLNEGESGTESYVGDNGFIWHVNGTSSKNHIDFSKELYFEKGKIGLQSNPISGGIKSFSVQIKDVLDTNQERLVELLVNGNVVGSITHTGAEVYTFSVNDINVEGDIVIAIKNSSGLLPGIGLTDCAIAIDNISWIPLNPTDVCYNDTEAPTITCPEDIILNNTPGECGAIANFEATFTDNCDGTEITYSLAPGSLFPVGTTEVTAIATDAAGNEASCTFNVTVNDSEAPQILCPSEMILNNDPGECGAIANFEAIVSDNCQVEQVTYYPVSGSFFAVGTTEVLVTATDAAGNKIDCTFNVIVNDAESPIINCPADLTIECDEDTEPESTGMATATDNCDTGITLTHNDTILTYGTCENIYTIERVFTATDNSGNTSSCTQNLTVQDTRAPINVEINAPVKPVHIGTPFNISATYEDCKPVSATFALSNNDVDYITYNADVAEQVVSLPTETTKSIPAGVYKIVVSIIDECNNSTQEEFTYLVVFDPNGGFVIGGGNFYSNLGAYRPDLTKVGKVKFGFVARYDPDDQLYYEVKGATRFNFKDGNFSFKSTSYEPMTLVVTDEKKASYRGVGKVNDAGAHKFLVVAIDGDANGGNGIDRFRIKVFDDGDSEEVIYDNEYGLAENADVSTDLGRGAILIHKEENYSKKSLKTKTEEAFHDQGYKLMSWPNPSADFFSLKLFSPNKDSQVEISVLDISGKQVYSSIILANSEHQFGRSLSPGLYMVRISQGQMMKTVKLIKL